MSGHFGLVIGCFSSSESLLEGMMPCFCSENDSGLLFSTDCPVMKKPLPVSLCSERNVNGREMFFVGCGGSICGNVLFFRRIFRIFGQMKGCLN